MVLTLTPPIRGRPDVEIKNLVSRAGRNMISSKQPPRIFRFQRLHTMENRAASYL